jgi:hypothetical protein
MDRLAKNNMTNTYSEWVATSPKKQFINGSNEFKAPKAPSDVLKRGSVTPAARLLINQERVSAENELDEIVSSYSRVKLTESEQRIAEHFEPIQRPAEFKEQEAYVVSLRAQRELNSYMSGDMCPVNRSHHEYLQRVNNVKDRHDVESIEDIIESPEAVCEALEGLTSGYMPEKEHNALEKAGELDLNSVDMSELLWIASEDAEKLDTWYKNEEQRRIGEWLATQPSLNEDCFLLRAMIPSFKLKLNKTWTFMDNKRTLATWKSWSKARYHVFLKILKSLDPSFNTKCEFKAIAKRVRELCDEQGVTLNMNMCDVQCRERKVETKTLVFSIHRKLTEPTRYVKYSKAQDMSGNAEENVGAVDTKFKRFILANADGVAPTAPLTGYELEKEVMGGKFDEEDLISMTFEHPEDKNLEEFVPAYEADELTTSEDAYVSFWSIRGRFDLADAFMGVGDDKRVSKLGRDEMGELHMLPELAESIWNGEFSVEAANELFGTFWNDSRGNLRRGAYLYEAFSVLLKDGYFESNVKLTKRNYMEAHMNLARLSGDGSPMNKFQKKAWGRAKAIADGSRILITLAKLINTPFEEGQTSFDRIAKALVNRKAESLIWKYGMEAVYGIGKQEVETDAVASYKAYKASVNN